jgi:rhamnulokinase
MAATTAAVVERLGDVGDVVLLGGGARDDFLAQRIAAHSGRPVRRGPIEAAATGNALVQGTALGVFGDLADARRALVDA